MPGKEIPIAELSPSHLNQLSQHLDQEIELLQTSMSQLKMVQNKYTESRDSLEKLVPENKGKEILVPLTSSMYVNGQLSDVNKVLINIGTGYYVEKFFMEVYIQKSLGLGRSPIHLTEAKLQQIMEISEARDYFNRRIEFLTSQIEKLQPALQEKFRMKQAVVEMLQVKVQAQIAAQQQGTKS